MHKKRRGGGDTTAPPLEKDIERDIIAGNLNGLHKMWRVFSGHRGHDVQADGLRLSLLEYANIWQLGMSLSMTVCFALLLFSPKDVDETIPGVKIASYLFVFYAFVATCTCCRAIVLITQTQEDLHLIPSRFIGNYLAACSRIGRIGIVGCEFSPNVWTDHAMRLLVTSGFFLLYTMHGVLAGVICLGIYAMYKKSEAGYYKDRTDTWRALEFSVAQYTARGELEEEAETTTGSTKDQDEWLIKWKKRAREAREARDAPDSNSEDVDHGFFWMSRSGFKDVFASNKGRADERKPDGWTEFVTHVILDFINDLFCLKTLQKLAEFTLKEETCLDFYKKLGSSADSCAAAAGMLEAIPVVGHTIHILRDYFKKQVDNRKKSIERREKWVSELEAFIDDHAVQRSSAGQDVPVRSIDRLREEETAKNLVERSGARLPGQSRMQGLAPGAQHQHQRGTYNLLDDE